MSAIVPLIALAAFVYGLVILIIALVRHTPRLVDPIDLSVWLYRLLLAAYPARFREEYGAAMVQLFRDTARDAIRRRGVLGLSALWLRTLADFTISVIRQYRDLPVPISSESALLLDLLQKWRRLGSEALSVSAFSLWYGWHLLRLYLQRAVLVWATLTAIVSGIWVTSLFDSIGGTRGRITGVGIVRGGAVLIWHGYEEGGPISDEQWQRDCREWVKKNPSLPGQLSAPVRPWEFGFLSDIPEARTIQYGPDRKPVLVQPYKSWRLRFPFGIFPVLLLAWTIRVYLRRNTHSVAAMQSA
jgi:hypothetical protein